MTTARNARIGLMSFSDGRQRVHETLRPEIERYQNRLVAVLDEMGFDVVCADEIVYRPRQAVAQAKRMLAEDVAAVVFNVSVFSFPALSALAAATLGDRPVAIASAGEPHLPGMGGLLAVSGALVQMGRPPVRLWGAFERDPVRGRLEAFCRGAGARHRLRGQVYGQIGGRSIGMITGVSSSPAEWLRRFGVDIDHVDQSEILRRADLVDQKRRREIVAWLERSLGSVGYQEGSKLTPKTLEYQAACAEAVKQIIDDRQFDFIGIKCHFDLSEYYCTQCLSAALLPSLLDWDGPREPIACACEADGDGALTMQILQLVSSRPALFMDLRHYNRDAGRWTLCNCGAQSVTYARRSADPAENLKAASLVPVIAKYGGVGAHVPYLGSPGEMTFARLMHDDRGPRLLLCRGRAVAAQPAWTQESCPAWPHIFAELDADPRWLLDHLDANHIHAVDGDCIEALRMFAHVTDVPLVEA